MGSHDCTSKAISKVLGDKDIFMFGQEPETEFSSGETSQELMRVIDCIRRGTFGEMFLDVLNPILDEIADG